MVNKDKYIILFRHFAPWPSSDPRAKFMEIVQGNPSVGGGVKRKRVAK